MCEFKNNKCFSNYYFLLLIYRKIQNLLTNLSIFFLIKYNVLVSKKFHKLFLINNYIYFLQQQ